jgi:hypothetical protein
LAQCCCYHCQLLHLRLQLLLLLHLLLHLHLLQQQQEHPPPPQLPAAAPWFSCRLFVFSSLQLLG